MSKYIIKNKANVAVMRYPDQKQVVEIEFILA